MKRYLISVLVVLAVATGCAKREPGSSAPEASVAPTPATDNSTPATDTPATPPGVIDAAPVDEAAAACDAEPAKQYIEQAYTPELGEQARVAAGAKLVRALRPGQITTMEFLDDRLTLTLDESGRIASVRCG